MFFFKKKITLIIVSLAFFFLILFLFIFFYKDIPYDLRQSIKKKVKYSTHYLKYESLYKNQKDFPNTLLVKLNFTKIYVKDHYNTLKSGNKASGYIDIYKNKLIFVSGNGTIRFYPIPQILKKQDTHQVVQSNLKDIINDELFYDVSYKTPLTFKVAVNDILVDDGYLYLSYVKKLNNGSYNTSIVRAKINDDYIKFVNFFDYLESVSPKTKNFNVQASGGRMAIYYYKKQKKIIFTIGTFLAGDDLAQDDQSYFGKIILIDVNNNKHLKFAKGFRNPQGLLVVDGKILATEHGPQGGDEINLVKENFNYGWPIASYGERYLYNYNDPLKYKKKHTKFEEPVFSFVPSIGISQIINLPDNFNPNWKDNFLLTSLKGHSIFRLSLNKDFSRIISMERIIIGERIRDIIYDKDNKIIFLVLEDSGSIGILRN